MEKQTEGPGHRRLLAWQEAKTLASLAYEMCLKQRHLIDRGLADQLRRAAISIPSNIAEGNGRGSNKDSLRFLYIARGSLCELETQVEVCRDVKLLADDDSSADLSTIGSERQTKVMSQKSPIATCHPSELNSVLCNPYSVICTPSPPPTPSSPTPHISHNPSHRSPARCSVPVRRR
jgi:four helix bundle protein